MVLPPGYEDAMLCLKGDQPVYQNPSELLGAASSFWKCAPKNGSAYPGVWLGSRVTPPADVTPERYDCVRGDCTLFRTAQTTRDESVGGSGSGCCIL